VLIVVRVRPGSVRPGVGGHHDEALVVRVSERAADGKATAAEYGTTLDLDTTLRENTSQGFDAASNFSPTVIAWIVAVLTGLWLLWRRRRRHGWRWQQPVVVLASTLLILTGPMTILLTVNGALTTRRLPAGS
jgi:uncharacterized protein (TIGR03382 family)